VVQIKVASKVIQQKDAAARQY